MDYTGKIISKNPPQPTQASASGVWTLDEAAAAVKNNSWPIPGVPNPVSKSLRFNQPDSTYLNRTPGSAGNRKTWTWSAWIKLSTLGTIRHMFFGSSGDLTAGTDYGTTIRFDANNNLEIFDYTNGGFNFDLVTTQVFRDPSSWYHIVVAFDTTQATSTNRVKLYINGSQVTAFGTATYPTQNTDYWINSANLQLIGDLTANGGGGSTTQYFSGYMAEMYFIDGQALTPSSFGQTNANTGVWEPKPYTGTYGGNGFYLNFKDSATTTALGYDYSGNGNNWTPNNFSVTAGAGNDSLVDVPTQWIGYNTSGDTGGIWRGNYATLNPLAKASTVALANGNLDFSSSAGNVWVSAVSTMPVSSGKWYAEFTPTVAGQVFCFGIIAASAANTVKFFESALGYGYYSDGSASYKFNNNTNGGSYGAAFGNGDVVGVALDLDAGTLVFYKNGVSQGTAYSSLSGTFVFAGAGFSNGSTPTYVSNFGQRPFAYTPPAGFVSLCTTNLPTPTIGATATTRADDYFNTVLYTGNGGTQSVTGVGFQPDFVWLKNRSAANSHAFEDVLRGAGYTLASNDTSAEINYSSYFTAFTSDGFNMALGGGTFNNNGSSYVAWNWKANGAGSSNTAGTITSTVSANTTSGFSIATMTAPGSGTATFGHGLGVAPSMIIFKLLDVTGNWVVYHSAIGATGALRLNLDSATSTSSIWFNDTAPTSTVATLGIAFAGGGDLVAYCFAPVAGYSAFGSYTGNGSSDGTFVYTGFRPAFVLVKGYTGTNAGSVSWWIFDGKRPGYNVTSNRLAPNLSDAEYSNGTIVDFTSNGFKWRDSSGGWNDSAITYIYAAFAEVPLKFSLAR